MNRARLRRLATAVAAVVAVSLSAVTLTSPPAAQGAVEISMIPKGTIGFSGHAGLYGWGAATMRDGSVLVGDYWNMRVLRYAADGTPMGVFIQNAGYQPHQHQAPYGLAVDPDNGDVYLADTDRRQVDRYNEQGEFLNSFGVDGVSGETPGRFLYPSRVAVKDGHVFIADTWAHRIVVYTRTGTTEEFAYKAQGSKLGQLRSPHGISFDSQGRLHVVDSGNKRISVFRVDLAAKTLTFDFKYGAAYNATNPTPAPGAVFRGDLRGLAIDKVTNVVYVVDAEGNRIHKFTTDGQFLKSWGKTTPPGTTVPAGTFSDGGREATVDGNGNLWVGDMPQFQVQVFSPEGTHLFNDPNPAQPPPPGGFNSPRGVAVDRDGNVLVSDTYNFRVQKLAPNGTMLAEWGTRGRSAFEFNYTRLIATDPRDGSVIVTDTDNHRIKKYSTDGAFLGELGKLGTAPGQFKNPHGVDIGPDGTVYVADTVNSRVQVIPPQYLENPTDPTNPPILTFGSLGNGNGQFRRPRGIVADDVTGDIYVTDAIRKNVQVFSATGAYLRTIGAPGSSPQQMGGPFDIEVDDSYVYVADSDRNTIAVWGKDGRWIGEYGGGGAAPGKLRTPQGLALVGDRLYIAEQENERVSVWQVYRGEALPDTTRPTSTVTSPAAGSTVIGRPVALSGSASDDQGLAKVQVAVKDQASALFWNPVTKAWQTGAVWTDTALASPGETSSTWSGVFDDSPAPGSGAYLLQKRAVDLSGNLEVVVGTKFNVGDQPPDTTAPTSALTSPTAGEVVAGRPVTVTGTATDDRAVGTALVALKDRTTGLWWNATDVTWQSAVWWGTATLDAPGAATSTWTWVFDDGGAPGSGSYFVQQRAKDASGNTGTTSGLGFRVS